MVKVWYEPPPGGPRTHLNRGGYYVESARTPALITKLSKARPITVIFPAIAAISALCYIPLSKYRLKIYNRERFRDRDVMDSYVACD